MAGRKTVKVILIDPPEFSQTGQAGKTQPNIGLAYLNAVLKEMGIESRILDAIGLGYDDIDKIIADYKPDVVGLTAKTFHIVSAAEIAKRAKSMDKNILTIIGGAHLTALPVRTLKEFKQFDMGIIGEGEETIKEIMHNLKSIRKPATLKEIKGIVYRDGPDIRITEHRPPLEDVDSVPYPNWKGIDFSKYIKKYSGRFRGEFLLFPVCFSRGCPFNCSFCFNFNRRWKNRKPEKVVDEMEYFHKEHGAMLFEIIDSTSTIRKDVFMDFCNELIKRGLHKKITWYCETRVDRVDLELLKKMRSAGCEYVFYGIESGDPGILKRMNKKTTREQIRRAIRMTKKAGMNVRGSFIFGHPFENEKTVLNTINFAVELSKIGLDGASFYIIDVYPGTEVWDMVEKGEGGARWLKGKRFNWGSYSRSEPQIEVGNLTASRLRKLRDYAEKSFENSTMKKKLRRALVKILYKSETTKKVARKVKEHSVVKRIMSV
jgi:radical SAM superfamily enzyme YgiQ (UPF0313 family)